jgi:hypothetical protein
MNAAIERLVTEADLAQFCEDQRARYWAWRASFKCPPLDGETVDHRFSIGERYARIIRDEGKGGRSVVCFIDLANGDILKGAWKAPVARGVRGNIFTADRGASCMDGTSPKYLR